MNFSEYKKQLQAKNVGNVDWLISAMKDVITGFNNVFDDDDIVLILMHSESFGVANLLIANICHPYCPETICSFRMINNKIYYVNDSLVTIGKVPEDFEIEKSDNLEKTLKDVFNNPVAMELINQQMSLHHKDDYEVADKLLPSKFVKELFRGKPQTVELWGNSKRFNLGEFSAMYDANKHVVELITQVNSWTFTFS